MGKTNKEASAKNWVKKLTNKQAGAKKLGEKKLTNKQAGAKKLGEIKLTNKQAGAKNSMIKTKKQGSRCKKVG